MGFFNIWRILLLFAAYLICGYARMERPKNAEAFALLVAHDDFRVNNLEWQKFLLKVGMNPEKIIKVYPHSGRRGEYTITSTHKKCSWRIPSGLWRGNYPFRSFAIAGSWKCASKQRQVHQVHPYNCIRSILLGEGCDGEFQRNTCCSLSMIPNINPLNSERSILLSLVGHGGGDDKIHLAHDVEMSVAELFVRILGNPLFKGTHYFVDIDACYAETIADRIVLLRATAMIEVFRDAFIKFLIGRSKHSTGTGVYAVKIGGRTYTRNISLRALRGNEWEIVTTDWKAEAKQQIDPTESSDIKRNTDEITVSGSNSVGVVRSFNLDFDFDPVISYSSLSDEVSTSCKAEPCPATKHLRSEIQKILSFLPGPEVTETDFVSNPSAQQFEMEPFMRHGTEITSRLILGLLSNFLPSTQHSGLINSRGVVKFFTRFKAAIEEEKIGQR